MLPLGEEIERFHIFPNIWNCFNHFPYVRLNLIRTVCFRMEGFFEMYKFLEECQPWRRSCKWVKATSSALLTLKDFFLLTLSSSLSFYLFIWDGQPRVSLEQRNLEGRRSFGLLSLHEGHEKSLGQKPITECERYRQSAHHGWSIWTNCTQNLKNAGKWKNFKASQCFNSKTNGSLELFGIVY